MVTDIGIYARHLRTIIQELVEVPRLQGLIDAGMSPISGFHTKSAQRSLSVS